MSRWSIAQKALLATVTVEGLVALAQFTGLARGWPLWFAICAPLVIASAIAWTYTHFVATLRMRTLVGGLQRVAAGDFRFELPPPPDRDLIPVRAAFVSMGLQLDELTTRLKQVDSERRRLFADLVHELATPTSTVLAVSELLRAPPPGSAGATLLDTLEGEAARIERLIGDLRVLAQMDDPQLSLEKASIDVAELTARVVETRRVLRPGRSFDCHADRVIAQVDAQRIEQVLVNLLANAERHTPPDGVIRVSVRPTDAGAQIAVEDSGQGVDEQALARLGERLYRPDPSRSRKTGGSGLGLAIVRAVIERHGGQVRFARSTLGGLSVSAELPLT
jgi:signal transduction histidine kinase